jgi:signal transduction histidine kinase
MCILKHNGCKNCLAAAARVGALVVASTLAAPALPSEGSQTSPPNQVGDSTNQEPIFALRSVKVNDRELPGISMAGVTLPAHPDTTAFTYSPNPQATNIPIRYRCQLDGYESGWYERTVPMRLLIRFIDANERDIAQQEFNPRGQSPNWTGRFTDSPWVQRKEVVTVPADAVRIWVVISSAGPPEAVGVFAVRNLMVRRTQGDKNEIRLIQPVVRDASIADVEGVEVSPAGWARGGIRVADARLLRYGPGSEVALAIFDGNPKGHADWHKTKVQVPELTPGETLKFEWEEIYSIGSADLGNPIYTNIPAGLYRFRMEALNLMGLPTGRSVSLPVTVPVAFWRTIWFWVATMVALFAVAAGGWRLAESKKMKRKVQKLERQRDLEQERLRIAQDIHDDLGARVTEISLLSSSSQLMPNLSLEARAKFEAIYGRTDELVRALYETVWSVNPKNDHLDSLVIYTSQMADQMCAAANLKCRFEIPDLPDEILVTSPIRHHVILAVKEAIHNVIKHAHATELKLRIQHANGVLSIQVSDNGCGFDPAVKVRGNGRNNMERRMRSLQGSCLVASQPEAGTKVTFEFPLPIT